MISADFNLSEYKIGIFAKFLLVLPNQFAIEWMNECEMETNNGKWASINEDETKSTSYQFNRLQFMIFEWKLFRGFSREEYVFNMLSVNWIICLKWSKYFTVCSRKWRKK